MDVTHQIRWKRRTNLRSLFAWMFCIAIALTVSGGGEPISVDWRLALLATAATAIAIDLLRQSSAIWCDVQTGQLQNPGHRFSARLECFWRVFLAVMLAAWLVAQFLITRGFIELSQFRTVVGYSVLTDYPGWLLIIIALSEGQIPRGADGVVPHPARRRLIDVVAWTGISLFLCYVIIDQSLVLYITHVGLRGIDATLEHTGNRYPVWSPHDEWQFLLMAGGAMIAYFVGGALLLRTVNTTRPSSMPRLSAALGSLFLLAPIAYDWWYYRIAFAALSPDLASVGPASNEWQWLGAIMLAAILATVGAMRISRNVARKSSADIIALDVPPAAERLPTSLLLCVAAGYSVVMLVWSAFEPTPFYAWYEMLAFTLTYPDTAFFIAMGVLSFQLARLAWKGKQPHPLRIAPSSPKLFAAAWLSLVAVIAIGVPTFAAFSFSFWLGPWYRW